MRIASAASLILLTGSLAAAAGQSLATDVTSGPAAAPKRPISFDLSAIDKTADPCVDFYQYACGNWVKQNPIPPTETRWSRFNELGERNQYLLWEELKAAAEHPQGPLQTKYGNLYAACMDTAPIDKLGAKPITPELQVIDTWTDKKKLAQLDVTLATRFGGGGFLGVGVGQDQKDSTRQILQTGQGGLTLPDRDYYLSTEPRYAKIRDQYRDHMVRMFQLLGDDEQKSSQEANDVLRIETALAQGSMDRTEMRDPAKRYHIMTVAQTQALSPDFAWATYLDGIGVGSATTLNVSSPEFVKTVNTELETENLPALRAYLRWHVLHSAAPYLAKPYVDEDFAFFQQTLAGQKEQQPRWKLCTRLTDRALGEAVGQDWVKKNFPPDAKANMEQLVAALKKALDEDIQTLPWMSDQTKAEAEKKLAAFRQKIGYPEHWRDYSALTIKRDDLIGDADRISIYERDYNLHKLGKPVDETEWGMTPPTVNAYYNPPQNDINFPAGILQPPFYDPKQDAAVNFGGIGVVIGHEMTHGFDDQGSKYGPSGNVKYTDDGKLASWFTPEDQKKFDDRTKCIADEYSNFKVAEGQNLNGRLTLGENTADNGGIRIAYRALEETLAKQGVAPDSRVEGYTPAQQFFLGFGQVWCENRTEQAERIMAKTDPHSTGQWRTDGTVQNFEEFGKAFGCKVGQPMYPAHACRVW